MPADYQIIFKKSSITTIRGEGKTEALSTIFLIDIFINNNL